MKKINWNISIHAPRVGGDLSVLPAQRLVPNISIHAPRVGGDPSLPESSPRPRHFNPRPPCGGRRVHGRYALKCLVISIHAPRVGGDMSS